MESAYRIDWVNDVAPPISDHTRRIVEAVYADMEETILALVAAGVPITSISVKDPKFCMETRTLTGVVVYPM